MATGEPDSQAAYKHFHTPPGEGTSMQLPLASPHVRAPVAASIRKHFKNDDSWMSHHTPRALLLDPEPTHHLIVQSLPKLGVAPTQPMQYAGHGHGQT